MVRIVMEEGFAPGLDCCDLNKEVTERKQWQQQPRQVDSMKNE